MARLKTWMTKKKNSRLENVLSAPFFEQEKLRLKNKKLDRLFINIEPFVGYGFWSSVGKPNESLKIEEANLKP